MTELTVVIPTLGTRPLLLERLLRSIAMQTRPPVETLVVVPHDVPFEDPQGVRTVRAPRSVPAQRKVGAEAAGTPVVLFVDDDMVLAPDFVAAVLEVWDRRGLDALGGVCGTITNIGVDPVWREMLRAVAGLSYVGRRGSETRIMASGHVRYTRSAEGERTVEFAAGAIMSLRRDLLLLEPPDTQFDGYVYGDDLDLAARISRHAPIVQTSIARAEHLPVDSGLGWGPEAAYRRSRHYAYYRGLYRQPGRMGSAAWHWANFTEGTVVAAKSLKRRDISSVRAYARGLREAKEALRAHV